MLGFEDGLNLGLAVVEKNPEAVVEFGINSIT